MKRFLLFLCLTSLTACAQPTPVPIYLTPFVRTNLNYATNQADARGRMGIVATNSGYNQLANAVDVKVITTNGSILGLSSNLNDWAQIATNVVISSNTVSTIAASTAVGMNVITQNYAGAIPYFSLANGIRVPVTGLGDPTDVDYWLFKRLGPAGSRSFDLDYESEANGIKIIFRTFTNYFRFDVPVTLNGVGMSASGMTNANLTANYPVFSDASKALTSRLITTNDVDAWMDTDYRNSSTYVKDSLGTQLLVASNGVLYAYAPIIVISTNDLSTIGRLALTNLSGSGYGLAWDGTSQQVYLTNFTSTTSGSVTNVTVTGGEPLLSFSTSGNPTNPVVTASLSYTPPNSSYASIVGAMGFTPATNNPPFEGSLMVLDGVVPTNVVNVPVTNNVAETLQIDVTMQGATNSATFRYILLAKNINGVLTNPQSALLVWRIPTNNVTTNWNLSVSVSGTTNQMKITGVTNDNANVRMKVTVLDWVENPLASVATPALDFAAGTYNTNFSVTITNATSAASIFYATNGSA